MVHGPEIIRLCLSAKLVAQVATYLNIFEKTVHGSYLDLYDHKLNDNKNQALNQNLYVSH